MTQEFETTLIPQDIVVRQDDGSDEHIEENAGLWFPLIKVKDMVFDKGMISSFNYSVGVDLLPSISVTIEDENKSFSEEQFPNEGDLVTIRISNNADTIHKPIKLDFMIIETSGSTDSRTISFDAVQYVPILHKRNNKGYNDSLINIAKDVAKECGLGFVTNMSDSGDTSNWICVNTYYDFLKYIEQRMYISDDDTCKIFIDQFNNLNVVSLKTAYSDRTVTQLKTNPSTGQEYEQNVDLTFNNKTYLEQEDLWVQINQWIPITNYGRGFLLSKEVDTYKQKNSEKHFNTPSETEVNVQNVNALEDSANVTWSDYVDGDTVFNNILTSRKQNERLRTIYKQGTYVLASLEFYIPDIFTYMYVPCTFWNKRRRDELRNQDESLDQNDVSEKDPKYRTNDGVINEEFSGDYVIVENTFMYNGESNIIHEVRMIKV